MRLIDADALIEDIDGDLTDSIAEGRAIEKIMNAPTIEERKTGKWIIDDDWNMCDIEGTLIGTKEYECDKCGYRELVFDGTVTHLNYCPNCGADMRQSEGINV